MLHTILTDLTGIGILGLIINVVVISVVLIILDRFIAHEIAVKHSVIMAAIAYFLAPLSMVLLSQYGISIPFGHYIIPLVIWIALGEILLKSDMKKKAIVAAAAFITYTVLTISGLVGAIAGLF